MAVLLRDHDHKARIRMLERFRDKISDDANFDHDDIQAVEGEIQRLQNDKLAFVKQTLQERLETLKEADDLFNFEVFHPQLNTYWLRKHEQLVQKSEILEKQQASAQVVAHSNDDRSQPRKRQQQKQKLLRNLEKQARDLQEI